MEKMTPLCLLLVGLNFALAAEIPKYFMERGELTLELRPPSSEPINYILWKFDGNLLGEWVKNKVDLTYYSAFQNRTTLDTNTGRLKISSMTKADVGVYSVEINNKLQPDQYKAVLIKAVTQPEVVIRPLICDSNWEKCTATCEADTRDAGPITYSWKMGDGEWKDLVETIDITKADTANVETFTCRVKNPLSESESERKDNPLFREDEPGSLSAGGIAGILLGLIGATAAVVGLGVAWKQKKGPFKNRGSTGAAAGNQHVLDVKEPPVNAEGTPVNAEGTPVNAEGTPVNAEVTPVNAEDTPDEASAAEKQPLNGQKA